MSAAARWARRNDDRPSVLILAVHATDGVASLAPPADRQLAIHRAVLMLKPRFIGRQIGVNVQIRGARLAVADRR
jgi:hypothetical protein